jgi:hypothetical protein
MQNLFAIITHRKIIGESVTCITWFKELHEILSEDSQPQIISILTIGQYMSFHEIKVDKTA